jgi:hypothetical protein
VAIDCDKKGVQLSTLSFWLLTTSNLHGVRISNISKTEIVELANRNDETTSAHSHKALQFRLVYASI